MFCGISFKETAALDVLKVNSAEKLTRIVADSSVMFKLMDKCPAKHHPTFSIHKEKTYSIYAGYPARLTWQPA